MADGGGRLASGARNFGRRQLIRLGLRPQWTIAPDGRDVLWVPAAGAWQDPESGCWYDESGDPVPRRVLPSLEKFGHDGVLVGSESEPWFEAPTDS